MKYNKYVYNYDVEETNQLIKKGVHPIGCGTNDKTGGVFHVFEPTRTYFTILSMLRGTETV